jgi:hypothetical protein
MHAGVADFWAALYITYDSQKMIWLSFFQYLVDNSFCPWLMIVRGRPSTTIILEATTHLYDLYSVSGKISLSTLGAFLSCVSELTYGPAVGLALMAFWLFVSNKLYALAYSKLFNRRK